MRDNGSIKQTEVKNIAIAQRVMGYEKKNNDEHKYFCGTIFWIYRTKTKQN